MGAAPLLLTSCNKESNSEGLYTSVEACVIQTGDRASCERAYANAQRQAEATAPQYATLEECVAAYGEGQCQENSGSTGSANSHHSFFMPMMAGFLIGRMMNGNQITGLSSSPAFKDRGGNWQRPAATPGNSSAYNRNMAARAPMAPVNMQADRAPTTTRAGFGSRSGTRASGG
jgi:uncharacterized protein YgiB involved in biofilm formation